LNPPISISEGQLKNQLDYLQKVTWQILEAATESTASDGNASNLRPKSHSPTVSLRPDLPPKDRITRTSARPQNSESAPPDALRCLDSAFFRPFYAAPTLRCRFARPPDMRLATFSICSNRFLCWPVPAWMRAM
jgi:hypothetical protein